MSDTVAVKKYTKEERAAMTAEQIKKLPKKERQGILNDNRKDAKKAAFDRIREAMDKLVKNELFETMLDGGAKEVAALAADLKTLVPLRSEGGEVHETVQSKLARLFNGKKTVNGFDVYKFEDTHWGVSDMRRNMILAIKTGDPDNRMWIDYNGKSDEYTLVATGAKPPFAWTGYTPIEAAIAE